MFRRSIANEPCDSRGAIVAYELIYRQISIFDDPISGIQAGGFERRFAKSDGDDGKVDRGRRGRLRQRGRLLGVGLRDNAATEFNATAEPTEASSILAVYARRGQRDAPSVLGIHHQLGRVSIRDVRIVSLIWTGEK